MDEWMNEWMDGWRENELMNEWMRRRKKNLGYQGEQKRLQQNIIDLEEQWVSEQ